MLAAFCRVSSSLNAVRIASIPVTLRVSSAAIAEWNAEPMRARGLVFGRNVASWLNAKRNSQVTSV